MALTEGDMDVVITREFSDTDMNPVDTDAAVLAICEVDRETTLAIVDFDETLWLRNSTECYLSTLRPRIVAVLILGLIDLFRPWLLLPGDRKRHIYRDWIRVVVTSLLLPWNLVLWRWRARKLAAEWTNEPLLAALQRSGLSIHIATFGFRLLVHPLLRQMLPTAKLCVAGSFWTGYRLRSVGKLKSVERKLGSDAVARSVVITDGVEDRDLLQACRKPLFVQWPDASYEPSFSHHYMPFEYTERGKRKGQRYLFHNVILEDVVLLCLAFAWLMPSPHIGAVGILLLHLSFWTVYEIGYWENDVLAVKNEAKPNIPEGTQACASRMHRGMAWLTAIIIATPGVAMLTYFNREAMPFGLGAVSWPMAFLGMLGMWVLYLLLSRWTYWIYNRLDTDSRSYLYVPLQMSRSVGYAFFFLTNAAGILLLTALIVGRWIPYLSYRMTGVSWSGSHRLLMFILALTLGATGLFVDSALLVNMQFAVGVLYLGARAHKPLRKLVKDARLHQTTSA
jgi:phosphoserine phosphatase